MSEGGLLEPRTTPLGIAPLTLIGEDESSVSPPG